MILRDKSIVELWFTHQHQSNPELTVSNDCKLPKWRCELYIWRPNTFAMEMEGQRLEIGLQRAAYVSGGLPRPANSL